MKKLSLKTKLITVMTFLGLGTLFICFLAYRSLNNVSNSYQKIVEQSFSKSDHITGMRARSRQVQGLIYQLYAYEKDPTQLKSSLDELKKSTKRYNEISDEYLKDGFSYDQEKKLYDSSVVNWRKLEKVQAEILKGLEEDPTYKTKLLEVMKTRYDVSVKAHQKDLKDLDDFNIDAGNKLATEAKNTATHNSQLILVIGLVTFAASIGIALVISIALTRKINAIVVKLELSANSSKEQSDDVAVSSIKLNEVATEQASSLQETMAATTEINAMVQKNSDNTNSAQEKAQDCVNSAQEGQRNIQKVKKAVDDIKKSSEEISRTLAQNNQDIERIVQAIKDISNKSKVINDIAFQTKLLSFNASIEAARAGAAGAGFSVVAEEVGKLAGVTSSSATEISDLINSRSDETEKIVRDSKAAFEKIIKENEVIIKNGLEVLSSCEDSFNTVLSEIGQMSSMITEVSHASIEQVQGLNQITEAVNLMNTVSLKTSESAQQCESSSSNLRKQTEDLNNVVVELNTTINGEKKAS